MADYGTNGDVALVRSATAPASSASLLVAKTAYAYDGTVSQTIDPAGTVTAFTVDQAGRQIQVVENYRAPSSSSSSSSSSGGLPRSDDTNVTTQWTYNADSLVATLTAVNAETGKQTTTYNYGTTLAASDVARSDLLASITYPDLGVVSYLYNRQGQVQQQPCGQPCRLDGTAHRPHLRSPRHVAKRDQLFQPGGRAGKRCE